MPKTKKKKYLRKIRNPKKKEGAVF